MISREFDPILQRFYSKIQVLTVKYLTVLYISCIIDLKWSVLTVNPEKKPKGEIF